MFDLFRSRDRLVRWFLSGLLLIVALSMVTYLIPSGSTGSRAADEGIIATIGGDQVTARQAMLILQAALRGRSLPPEMIGFYAPQMIESIITERAMAYEARRLGLQVTDEQTAEALRTNYPTFFPEGKFVGKDIYAATLAQRNLTIQDFEADVARQVLVSRLRNIVTAGTVVTPAEVESEFRHRNEKIKIEYVKLSPEKFHAEAKPADGEVRDYFNRNRAAYSTPEKRSYAILVIDQNRLEQSLNPSDSDLEKVYNADKDKYRTPERVKVRHILLKTTGKPAAEETKIKAKAEDLLTKIKGGADFAKLAKENSEDPGSAAKGGDLDWIVRGQTVKPFEEAAFSLKPGETSGLIKTVYGYHILQVQDKQDAHLKTFEESKPEILAAWKKERVGRMVRDISDKAYDALRKNPLHPEQVANQFNLPTPAIAGKAGLNDPLPEVGVNRDFQQSIAALKKGEVSQPVQVNPVKVAMAVVTDVFPAHPAPFEEAQAKISATLEKNKLDQLLQKKAADLANRAKSLNGDLAKAAAEMGFEVKTSNEFNRQEAIEGLGPATTVTEAFGKPAGALFGPLAIPDGSRIVGRLAARVPPPASTMAGQMQGVREELKQKKQQERVRLFEDGLRDRLTKEGKIKVHQDAIQRVISNYRA